MKTTVEISDELLARTRAVAQREGSTLRTLVEEGLQLALMRRAARGRTEAPALPVYGQGGLQSAMHDAGWADLREAIHRLPTGDR